jgi:HK97 gp10 family phage protein
MARAGAEIKGAKQLIAKLRRLAKQSTAAKVERRAVNLATTPIVQAVKASCPDGEGDLAKSIAKKVTGKGFTVDGIVGADADYVSQEGTKLKRVEAKAAIAAGEEDLKRPSHYDHLVEFGHKDADGGSVAPHPFLRPGWDASIDAAKRRYNAALAEGIEKEAMKG